MNGDPLPFLNVMRCDAKQRREGEKGVYRGGGANLVLVFAVGREEDGVRSKSGKGFLFLFCLSRLFYFRAANVLFFYKGSISLIYVRRR